MQALKALVAVMGVLIVAGLAALAVGIYHKATSKGETAVSASGSMPTPISVPASSVTNPIFAPASLDLPKDSQLETAMTDSGRLILQVRLGDGSRRFLVVNLNNGALLGTLTVQVPAGAVQ